MIDTCADIRQSLAGAHAREAGLHLGNARAPRQSKPLRLTSGVRGVRAGPREPESRGSSGISAENLRRLYAEHRAILRRHCTRILGESASAEDAVHEVFLRVARFRGQLPETAELRPWLFRIATNHCLNELRRRAIRARDLPGAWTDHPEDSLAARSDLRCFLTQLPRRACVVAWLTFGHGMLQQEVADVLGVSRRTVVTDLNRIRSSLSRLHAPRAPSPRREPEESTT